MLTISLPGTIRDFHSLPLDTWMRLWRLSTRPHRQRLNIPKCSGMHRGTYRGEAMRRCADLVDCGHENRDSDLFCRACALPLLGTALAGRYVVEALISKGGYAAVFRGVDQNLSRRIAIKVLLPSKTTPNEQEHFIREARVGKTITVRGTVGYMAPEQTSGVVDPRSDQFGCAVVLYEMLTGYNPFDANGGPIPPPSAFNKILPSALDTVLLRALAGRPADRYADMLEFLYAFDQATRPSSGFQQITTQMAQPDAWNSPIPPGAISPSAPAIQLGIER